MKNLKTAMMTSISEVLETMFFLSLDFDSHVTMESSGIVQDRISMACRLDFSGPLSGHFLLVLPEQLLAVMCANFMGIKTDEITLPHLEGTIKELTNMIAGNTFSNLDDQLAIRLSIPEIIEVQNVSAQHLKHPEKEVEILTETMDGYLGVKLILTDA